MMLSCHISLDMMTHTDHADLLQRNKIEANDFMKNMSVLCETILDVMWDKFGGFTISSGFRGPSLNARVGGVPTSQHCKGQAADLCRADWGWADLDAVANWVVKESGLKFGQVIRENHGGKVWLHVSTGDRCQALDYKDGKYTERRAA